MAIYQQVLEWLQQPLTMGFFGALTIAWVFHRIGKNSVPKVSAPVLSEEELKKMQQERDIDRRKLSRNIIANGVYKALVKEHKTNIRNKNAGLTAPETYSIACRLFTELRVPDALAALKKDLGIGQEAPKVDAPPATPAAAPSASADNNVLSLEEKMARAKAAAKAKRNNTSVAA